MKHLWFRLCLSLTALAVGIFYFCSLPGPKNSSVCQGQQVSQQGMIRISNLIMPRFTLNKISSLSFDVQESLFSPTQPLMYGNQVKGTVMYNGADSGTFSASQMVIDREKRTITLPTHVIFNLFDVTMEGEDVFYDIAKQEGVIHKNASGCHALFSFKAGMLTFNTHEQIVTLDNGVESAFFISRDKQQPQ